jgi:4-amino-4-deoxy-L-arabinose transferase-like glycosyltransferase
MMENDSRTSWWPMALLAAALAVVMFVFPLAIRFPLLDPDEGLHASIAQEMVERGDWLTPHFLGRPFLDKPIFYFWVQAASLRLLGMNETAVRLPGLMFGLLGVATTGLLAWRMFDRTTGLIAGIMYATTILPAALAQAASHDVALVPWVNLTILFLWEADRRGIRHTPCAVGPAPLSPASDTRRVPDTWACIFAAGVFLGLSILTKGLMGVAVVGLAYGGYVLYRWLSTRMPADNTSPNRKRGDRSNSPCLRFGLVCGGVLLVAVLVAAPWYLAIEAQNPGFLRYYFLDRHVLGLATDTQPHSNQPWWYYLPILLGGGLPWIGYLPIPRIRGQRAGGRVEKSEVQNPKSEIALPLSPFPLLWCWLFGWTVFLTLAQSKLATYLWPAFPPLAILAAAAWKEFIDGALTDAARRSFARTFVWSSWSGPLVLPAAVFVVQWVYAIRFAWPVWLAVCLAALLSPLPMIRWRAGRRQGSLAAAALSLAAQFVVVMTMVLPPLAATCSARELAEHFNRLGRLPPRLLMAEERIGSLVFYLTPTLRAGLAEGQLQNLLRDRSPQLRPGDVVAMAEQNRLRAAKYLDLGNTPYESVGRYRLYRIRTPHCTPHAPREEPASRGA